METLNIFSSIYFFIAFVIGAVFMLTVTITAMGKVQEPMNQEPSNDVQKQTNNVHFYVAREKSGALWLYMGKPIRTSVGFLYSHYCRFLGIGVEFSQYGLNMHDFDNLKWEDEPVEVFINFKD